MELPIYEALISENDDDNLEVAAIALVDTPAIKKNFFAFNEIKKYEAFVSNEDERIVTGLAMIAEQPIYRRDKDGDFYIYYTAPTIKKIVQKFFRKKYNFNLNLNHDPNYKLDDVYVFESYIVDRSIGKLPMQQFKDVPDGSWIVSAKVDNTEVWDAIKAGHFNGFSVEGFFSLTRTATAKDAITDDQFLQALRKLLQNVEL